ncbi:GGDEF domain-containing protein [Paenibacillus mucilaginosus]|uniref:GGDEF-domain-containing protein n=1 Tax=Paenibacillus mucilaginosus (strain KNP414) TaxID=1036673 RepID=F8FII5_PAEMK|nr:GGDEF domain-containing protein [Paenibacillus mucilaginosus]AEI44728.1 GGDEF-domain-containing protein [Paenibacillus mucilaginosus KNP414]WDM26273.1 GGDEF domain-containing protein [Paenibacillus mucilaginosus]WFA22747.1 GGDEF domain-containing protein [Paenibacillus mucilaginosus]
MPQDVFLNLSMNFLTMFVFFQLYFRYKVYVRSETVRHIILGVGFGLAQFLYRSFPIFIEGYREPIIIGGATFITAAVFGGGIAAFIAGCFPDLIGLAVRLIDPEGRPFMPGFLVFIWVTVAVVVLAFRFLKWRRWQIWLLLNFVFYVLLHFLTPNSASTSFAVYRMAIELGCGALIYYFVSYMHQAHVTQKQLERYALTDGLTGISNVRFFQEVFPKLFSAAQRGKIGLSLLVTDIDFFKKINDTLGHPAGDQVLVEYAGLLRDNFRGTEIITRNGGEEFSVMFANVNREQALEASKRFHELVRAHVFLEGHEKGPLKLTVSAGLAAYSGAYAEPGELYAAADEQLYKAKRDGRDRLYSV